MDDQMRLQAVVVDGFTGPLRKLREDLRSAGAIRSGKDMAHDWKGVREAVGGVTREFNTALAPVLRGIGITSLGIGAGVAGMVVGLKNVASYGRNLKFLSDQLGVSADKLREIQSLGEHFDISLGSTEGALKTFAGNMNELSRNWGAAFNTLKGMNLGGMAEDLKNAFAHGGLGEAFDKALEDLKKIPDPVYRRQIAQLLLGSDAWSVVATEQTRKLRETIRNDLGELPAGFDKMADQFVADLKRIERELSVLQIEFLGPLLKPVAEELEKINRLLDHLSKGEWKNVLRDFFHVRPGSLADKLTGAATDKDRLAADERRLKELDQGIAQAKKSGVAGTGYAELERQRLVDEIQKLRKALEDANNNALLQKQSFLGGGGGGGIVPAMYGGAGVSGLNDHLRRNLNVPPMGATAAPDSGPLGKPGQYRPEYHLSQRDLSDAVVNTIAGEAYTNDRRSVDAVINNMLNRVGTRMYGPSGDLQQVARAPGQYAGYRRATAKEAEFIRNRIRAIASGAVPDITGGSNEFRASWYHGPWAQRHAGAPVIGGNRFAVNPHADRGAYAPFPSPRSASTPLPPAAPPEIRGNARIDINFQNMPPGARIRHQFDGMFQQINIRRGRPMQSVWDA